MKSVARACLVPLFGLVALLSGCAYPPTMQNSYAFSQHPGVTMEVWWMPDWTGAGYPVTQLVNRSPVPKCAWTDSVDGHLLHPGETWQLGQFQQPASVGVANVEPSDPNCVNARQAYGAAAH